MTIQWGRDRLSFDQVRDMRTAALDALKVDRSDRDALLQLGFAERTRIELSEEPLVVLIGRAGDFDHGFGRICAAAVRWVNRLDAWTRRGLVA
jgi:hypothetical protein